MDIKRLRKFANRYLARQKIRAKDKELTEWLQEEQRLLIDHMIDQGVDRVSLAGGITLFTKTLIWAKYKGSKKEVLQALKECEETREMVSENFNAITLASYLRELNAEDKELPDALKKVLEPDPVSNLIAKKI